MGDRLAPYRVLLASRVRSQATYGRSFALDVLGSASVGIFEFAEVYIIFANVDALGGLDFAGVAMVFALANLAFALADLAVGHVDQLPTYLRTGTLDALLLRPLPVLAQLVTSDVSLRRLGRATVALVILGIALPLNDIEWTPARIVLLLLAPLAGAAIFAALFVIAGAVQFWLIEGGDLTAAFTYGGSYAASFPASVFAIPMRVLFTFVVPATFVAYLPTLVLLDLPGPGGLPQWLGWCTPLAAVGIWSVAALAWRAGLHRYTGAGS